MFSILGRIGHLLSHSGFQIDQLDVIYIGPNRSFTASSGLLCFTLYDEKNEKICVNIE